MNIVLTAGGNALAHRRIYEGDKVIITAMDTTPQPGDIVAAEDPETGNLFLVEYTPGADIKAIGKAVKVSRDLNTVPLLSFPDTHGINTLEGWNAAADRQNSKSFAAANGREPASPEELEAWLTATQEADRAATGREPVREDPQRV